MEEQVGASPRTSKIRELFDSQIGELALAELMSEFYVMGPTFDDNPYRMAFNEGQRNVVLYIMAKIKYNLIDGD